MRENLRSTSIALAFVAAAVAAGQVRAWHDTQIEVAKPPPTALTVQAEDCPGVAARFIVDDPSAWGGKSVRLEKDGPTLSFEHDCDISHYAVYVVCRAARDDFHPPSPPVVLHLRVTDLRTGAAREWRQRICFTNDWQDGGHLYFPIYERGRYRIEVFAGPRSSDAIRVDFLELKDLFGNLPKVGNKRSRNLHTDEEVVALRRLPASAQTAQRLTAEFARSGLASADEAARAAWRAQTFRDIWASLPPRNLHFAPGDRAPGTDDWTLNRGWGPWTFTNRKSNATYTFENWARGEVAGDCTFPDDGTGVYVAPEQPGAKPLQVNWMGAALMAKFQTLHPLASRRADEYLRTGNELAGWEGVCALLAACELYPDIDWQTQRFEFGGGQFDMNPYGKFVYSGHTWNHAKMLIEAYDHLFPLIQGNQALADLLREQVPWVRTPDDVVKYLDTNLLQHVRDCVDRQIIRSGDGDSELILALAALVQGPGEAADWMWDLIFTRCHFRMTNRGGIQDHFISSYNRDGCNYIGSAEYTKAAAAVAAQMAEICRRFRAIGGDLRFDLSDIAKYPKIGQAPYYALNRKAAGVWTPRIGEWGFASDPPQVGPTDPGYAEAREVYRFGFRTTGDPRFAWIVRAFGREDESDAEWAAIEAAAARQPADPFLSNTTRNMPGFGMVILEANPEQLDWKKKSAAVLRTGVGQGHGHCDQLGIIYYSQGAQLLTDNGRRGGTPNSLSTRVHNTVEVDDKDFLTVAFNRTGVGWAEAVAEMQGVCFASASARAPSHPHLKVYRRDVAIVPVGDDASYLFDVFRVSGGRVHTWCCQGPVNSSPDMVSFNAPMQPGQTPLTEAYLRGYQHPLTGTAPDLLEITWQVDPAAMERYLGRGATPPTTFVRAHRLDAAGDTVLRGWAQIRDYTGNGTDHNYTYTRREGADGLQGAYATISEGFVADRPVVGKVTPLAVARDDALAPRAVLVERADGRHDIVYSDGDGVGAWGNDGVEAEGRFAYVSMRDGQVLHAALLGGKRLRAGGLVVEPAVAQYAARVVGVDPAENAVTLDAPLPSALAGATFLVGRKADHDASYIAERVEGGRIRWRGAMQVYQSAITHFDPETGRVTPDLPPVLVEASPTYYNDLMVANEKGELLGPAEIVEGDRFMFLGFPHHMHWRQRLAWEELVDADGDGRRTLRMFNVGARTRRWLGEGRLEPVPDGAPMADLEVTRLRDDGLMIWFKDPPETYTDSLGVPHKSWPYQGKRLVTEDGRRTLQANYPGTEHFIGVKGRKLAEADFPDADGDGRRSLVILDFSPGDILETPSTVSLVRQADGTWRLKGNCDVRLTLPGRPAFTVPVGDAAQGVVIALTD